MLCVGLQEMVELSAVNVVAGDSSLFGHDVTDVTTRHKAWREILLEAINRVVVETNEAGHHADDHEAYVLVEEHNMVGLSMFLFARTTLLRTYTIGTTNTTTNSSNSSNSSNSGSNSSSSNKLCDYRRQIISDVRKGVVARGVGGLLGNKGATVIRFRLYDTSICIVNAHLAHGRTSKNLKARNADHASIMSDRCLIHQVLSSKKYIDDHFSLGLPSLLVAAKHEADAVHNRIMRMSKTNVSINIPLIGTVSLPIQHKLTYASSDEDTDDDTEASNEVSNINTTDSTVDVSDAEVSSSSSSVRQHNNPVLSADEHDIIFFMGDLNYRISQKITLDDAYALIDAHTTQNNNDNNNDSSSSNSNSSNVTTFLTGLFEHDQLHQELLKQGGSFRDFQEGSVSFTPTYKYIPGTHEYDRRPDKKMRCPAWCDRVLWKKGKHVDGEDVSLHAYHCLAAQTAVSDHKPVVAKFTIAAKQVDWQKRDSTLEHALALYTNPYPYPNPNPTNETTNSETTVANPYPLYQLDDMKNGIKLEPCFLSFSATTNTNTNTNTTTNTITITNKYHVPVLVTYSDTHADTHDDTHADTHDTSTCKRPSWVTFSGLDPDNGIVLGTRDKVTIAVNINDDAASSSSSSSNYTNPALLSLTKFITTAVHAMLRLRVSDALNKDVAVDVVVPITVSD